MPIADYPVKLTGIDSNRLADMAGTQMDLRMAAETAAQLSRLREQQNADMHVLEAMQAFALVRYGRCFRGGIRTAFIVPPAWIEELPGDLRAAHRDFIDLRDKYIAHSVNDWELNIPVARVRIDMDTGALDVHSVSVQQYRVLMLATDSLDKLWRLAKALAERVVEAMKGEQTRLLALAKQIPHDEIRRRIREDPADIPGVRNVGNPRAR